MQGHMLDLKRYRTTSGKRNFIEKIKVPIFLEAVLAIEIMWEPKLNLEENLWDLKRWFLLKSRPSYFNIIAIAPVILDWSTKQVEFSSTEIKTPLPALVSCRSEANFSCCHKSDGCSHLEYSVISSGRSVMYSRKSVGSRMECWGTSFL